MNVYDFGLSGFCVHCPLPSSREPDWSLAGHRTWLVSGPTKSGPFLGFPLSPTPLFYAHGFSTLLPPAPFLQLIKQTNKNWPH